MGIDLSCPVEKLDDDANFIEIIQQIIGTSIRSKQISDREICDLVFTPVNIPIGWFKFDMKDELIELGYKHVIERKEEILNKIRKIIKIKTDKKNIFGLLNI